MRKWVKKPSDEKIDCFVVVVVSLHASAAQLEVDTYSNLTFTLPPLVQNRHLRNVGTQLTSFHIKTSSGAGPQLTIQMFR